METPAFAATSLMLALRWCVFNADPFLLSISPVRQFAALGKNGGVTLLVSTKRSLAAGN